MTKLNSKLFNACTKRHRGAQPEHSIQHDRERGSEHKHGSGTSSVLPAPDFQAIPLTLTTGLRVLTDRAIASISMDTQLWEHCGYDHTNDGHLGKPLSRGAGARSVRRAPGQGPLPAGGPAPTAGTAVAISGVKNQPRRAGARGASGFVLKNGVSQVTPSRG